MRRKPYWGGAWNRARTRAKRTGRRVRCPMCELWLHPSLVVWRGGYPWHRDCRDPMPHTQAECEQRGLRCPPTGPKKTWQRR